MVSKVKTLSVVFVAVFILMGATAPQTEIEGELTVLVIDRPHQPDYEYHVKDAKGQRHKLTMPKSYKHGEKNLQSGQKVKVRGKKSGPAIAPLMEVGSLEVLAQVNVLTNTLGAHPTLVHVVNYSDQANPLSIEQVKASFLNDVNPLYKEMSFGRTWFSGAKNQTDPADFVTVTIPMRSGGCDFWTITGQARTASQNAGYGSFLNTPVNGFFSYTKLVYFIPPSPCPFAGIASLGGLGGFAVINGDTSCRVTSHELGHNFGLNHSDGDLGSYQDYTDVMGNQCGVFNIHQRERLGWINAPGFPSVPTVTQSGTYTIQALETQDMLPKGIKIQSSPGSYLYFSTRTGIHQGAGIRRAVYVHGAQENCCSYWRARVAQDPNDYFDFYLDPGDTWVHPQFSVTTVSLGPTSAVLSVVFGGVPPPPPAPPPPPVPPPPPPSPPPVPPPPPPAGSATIALAFESNWERDRVSPKALAPDGTMDALFTVTLSGGSRTITRLRMVDNFGGVWDTNGSGLPLGAAATYDAVLYNSNLTTVNFTVANGGKWNIFLADPEGHTGMSGGKFTLTVYFSDGTTAVRSF